MIRVGDAARAPDFADAAKGSLANAQLRRNVRHATDVIRGKRALVVGETSDWQQLREAGRQIKAHVLRHLDTYLQQFEENCTRAGGHVHWAADADEANRIIVDLIKARGESEVIKVKTMTSDETRLNVALEAAGIAPYETDLADLIIQLGDDRPSHIVVPALHRNRAEIREIFLRRMNLEALGGEPEDLTAAARQFLREKFLSVPVGFSGANFLVAGTGGVCVVESEGNARMCLTLPRMLITLAGIEKIVPTLQDLEVFLQLLPRSATGERMNPYNTHLDRHDRGRRSRGVSRRAARQRPHEGARRRARPRNAPLHPLRRVPQRMPRLPPDRRPCVWIDLQRSDRRHPDPSAAGSAAFAFAALRVVSLRRLLRGLPGQDQHSRDPHPPPRPHRRGERPGR